jgi:DNA-directed RNA polymerase specialized sigma24 family protein
MSTEAPSANEITELLHQMQDGDPSARDKLFRCAGQRLEAIARKKLRDFPAVRRWERTDDVLSEAVITLLKALESVDPRPASTREFLGLAGLHVRWALLRMKEKLIDSPSAPGHNHQTPGSYEGEWPPAEEGTNPPDWKIEHLVDKLPKRVREVFELHYYLDLPKKEIASLLGVNVKTVQRHWVEAHERFKALLDEGS